MQLRLRYVGIPRIVHLAIVLDPDDSSNTYRSLLDLAAGLANVYHATYKHRRYMYAAPQLHMHHLRLIEGLPDAEHVLASHSCLDRGGQHVDAAVLLDAPIRQLRSIRRSHHQHGAGHLRVHQAAIPPALHLHRRLLHDPDQSTGELGQQRGAALPSRGERQRLLGGYLLPIQGVAGRFRGVQIPAQLGRHGQLDEFGGLARELPRHRLLPRHDLLHADNHTEHADRHHVSNVQQACQGTQRARLAPKAEADGRVPLRRQLLHEVSLLLLSQGFQAAQQVNQHRSLQSLEVHKLCLHHDSNCGRNGA